MQVARGAVCHQFNLNVDDGVRDAQRVGDKVAEHGACGTSAGQRREEEGLRQKSVCGDKTV
jgi:hypothetical protein